jgi:hypothetical protein
MSRISQAIDNNERNTYPYSVDHRCLEYTWRLRLRPQAFHSAAYVKFRGFVCKAVEIEQDILR